MITEALVGAAFLGACGLVSCIGEDAPLRTKAAVVVVLAVAGAAIAVATMSVTRYITGVIADEAYSHITQEEGTND